MVFYRPRTKYDEKVIFLVCLSVHWGRGEEGGTQISGSRFLPCLWSQVLSGRGGTPVSGPRSFPHGGRGRGYSSQVLGQGTLLARTRGWGEGWGEVGEGIPRSGPGSGYPSPQPGPGQVGEGDTPVRSKIRIPPAPSHVQDRGVEGEGVPNQVLSQGTPRPRTAEGMDRISRRRTVCLLRSCRRTSLF